MASARVNIDPRAGSKRFFRRFLIFGIRDCKLALQDQMRCEAAMRVRGIVRISKVENSKVYHQYEFDRQSEEVKEIGVPRALTGHPST